MLCPWLQVVEDEEEVWRQLIYLIGTTEPGHYILVCLFTWGPKSVGELMVAELTVIFSVEETP